MRSSLFPLFLAIAGVCRAQPADLRYFRFLLMNVASIDHSPDAIAQYERSLVQQFGLTADESAVIHSAGQNLRTRLTELRSSSNVPAPLIADRDRFIAAAANQVLASLTPPTAARLRTPARLLAANVPSADGSATPITNLSDFQDCIGPGGADLGYGSVCQLAPGLYPVHTRLLIARSGIVITGTMIAGPSDTILQRADPNLIWLLYAAPGVTGVTVRNFTFDGNRYGLGLNCLAGNAQFYDVDVSAGSANTIESDDFINAPGTALVLGGTASAALLNFGQAGPHSATRSTAIYANDSSSAWYNVISYAGTAAITLNGSNQVAYGNTLFQNRYELSDGSGGGQLTVNPGTQAASVAANVIDGNLWPPLTKFNLATGCAAPPVRQPTSGIEAYGTGHVFLNNEIQNQTGAGMQIAGSSPTRLITISSANPFDPSDTPRFIERNSAGGIVFLGPSAGPFLFPAQGVTLDGLLVRNNSGVPGIVLDAVGNFGDFIGFVNGSCMSGNVAGNITFQSGLFLLYPVPSSYRELRGGQCPDPPWK